MNESFELILLKEKIQFHNFVSHIDLLYKKIYSQTFAYKWGIINKSFWNENNLGR